MVVWSVWKSREVRLVFSELVLGDIYLGIFLNKEPLVNLLILILRYSSETVTFSSRSIGFIANFYGFNEKLRISFQNHSLGH